MAKRLRGRKAVAWRRRIIFEEPLCRHCLAKGRVTETQEIDHIVALKDGGTNDRANLQGLCVECHLAKTTGKVAIGVDGWPVSD